MKLFATIGLGCLFCWPGLNSVSAHDCDHHGYHHGNSYNCDRQDYSCRRGGQFTGSQAPAAANLRTIEGKVTEVVYLPGATPETANVEIRLQSGSQNYLVRLAPSGFLKQSGLALREGAAVSVTGFAVAGMEGDIFVATGIQQNGKTLNLRDARGIPAW